MSIILNDQLIAGGGSGGGGDSGASRNIGEIVASTIPLTDAGLHLLDGSLINGSGSYSDFVDYIADLVSTYPDCFTTESDWQTSVTSYGVCGKFVYDNTNNTVRLPKITGFIEGTTDLTALNDLVEAGLPNITGSVGRGLSTTGVYVAGSGAFSVSDVGSTYMGTGSSSQNDVYKTFSIDASHSSSIYGNSDTVQPQAIKVLYYIVIATSTKTQIQVDIDEIATDLNGKVDKSSLTEIHAVIETYQNGTSWYRVYDDGWCEQGGYSVATDATNSLTHQIVFIKTFRDTSYIFSYQGRSTATPASVQASVWDFQYNNKTTNSILVWNSSTYQSGVDWQACGYIA